MNSLHLRSISAVFRTRFPVHPCKIRSLRATVLSRTMASVPKEFEEDLLKNPFYEKYSKKIRELQKTSPEDFKSRVEECKKIVSPKFGIAEGAGFSSVMKPKDVLRTSEKEINKSKILSDVMKMDLVEDMSAEEISKLWETYFKEKDGIAATISKDVYDIIYERGMKFPVFVLPLPRGEGYEFFLCQVERHEVHFTSLINYQAHKENAPECLTIVHYTDLENKGIVLLRGEFNKEVLNAYEAQCLANQFQLYYGKTNEKRLKMLERLNYNPDDFNHMDLIAELECLTLDSL